MFVDRCGRIFVHTFIKGNITYKFRTNLSLSRRLPFGCRSFSSVNHSPKICIIGSGPAGFYAAQHLVKALPDAEVDIYERLPVPFGLVRFGVAPDHPEVKNVINAFTKTAGNPHVRFIGHVNIGKDISLSQLRESYNAVLLAYGAELDRELDIPGENFDNVVSARRMVGWYNGLPNDANLSVNLDTEVAAILGQGNVALDVARILLTPVDELMSTDITEHSLSVLSKSRIKRVLLIGRRGPLQVAFTIKELREMVNLPRCRTEMDTSNFKGIPELIAELPRPRKRLIELLCKTALEPSKNVDAEKVFQPIFLRSPSAVLADSGRTISGLRLMVNKMENDKALPTGKEETIGCGLVLRSIGYKSIQVDPEVPFDHKQGLVPNQDGLVTPDLYVTGWLGTGPVGVILSTMTNAFSVARTIVKDITNGCSEKPGFADVKKRLNEWNVETVDWKGWEKIDKEEKKRGELFGKPREKIVDIDEMLRIART